MRELLWEQQKPLSLLFHSCLFLRLKLSFSVLQTSLPSELFETFGGEIVLFGQWKWVFLARAPAGILFKEAKQRLLKDVKLS